MHNHQGALRFRLIRAFLCSWQGLLWAFKSEPAFRLEVYLFITGFVGAIFLSMAWADLFLIAGSGLFVMIVELLNTAVEKTIDRISLDHHDLSGRIKDIASAAVFLSLLLTGGLWGAVFLKYIL